MGRGWDTAAGWRPQGAVGRARAARQQVREPNERRRTHARRSDIARVSRDQLLPLATKLMAVHACSGDMLASQVEGASGVFAPRDATKSDLLKMQKAMKEEQELLAKV